MCGKNESAIVLSELIIGSPPRVREKLKMDHKELVFLGITPACAGKTIALANRGSGSGDHPRVCGKNWVNFTSGIFELGSPPRVREKLKGNDGLSTEGGITPACAGKTKLMKKRLFQRQDHPRVCGKNGDLTVFLKFRIGSPPRVREKLQYDQELVP